MGSPWQSFVNGPSEPEGALVKYAGMVFNQRAGCRIILFLWKQAPVDLGPTTGGCQGQGLGKGAAQSDRKPGMLMVNIQFGPMRQLQKCTFSGSKNASIFFSPG